MKVGRNELCPCGSGARYKHCCAEKSNRRVSRFTLTALMVGGVLAVALLALAMSQKQSGTSGSAPVAGAPVPVGGNTPQPPGPAPAGKVWSPEHGHWHDAPVGGLTATPGESAPITVTPGSSAPITVTPPMAGQPSPQPPGPAPAGKVWSAEHGHWHDAPAGGAGTGGP